MTTVKEIIKTLESFARPENLDGMARFAIVGDKRMGVSMPNVRKIAKGIGKNHQLARELWRTGIPECMIVAGLIGEPDKLTEKQMEKWVQDFNSWDVCDQVCGNLFDKSPFVLNKIHEWSDRVEEFVKRAAFVLIAITAVHNKTANDKYFIDFFPLLIKGSTDERNFVRKAVNWAIRSIGKKNLNLNNEAINLSNKISQIESKSAHWIAADAIRELKSEAVQKRLNKKSFQ